MKMSDEEESKVDEEEQSIPLQGIVVDWQLPSKASLQDWLRKETEDDIRIREIVELLPKEVFQELEATRRNFYRNAERIIIRAYSLKLLPTEALPDFQELIEKTKKRLEALDVKIKKAIESEYHKKAVKYFEAVSRDTARRMGSVSGRMYVVMLPLRIDSILWDTFLTDEMKKEQDRQDKQFEKRQTQLNKRLTDIVNSIEDSQGQLEGYQRDIDDAEKVVEKAYESMTVPVDVATLKVERKKLNSQVRTLRAQERELRGKLDRLQRDRQTSQANYENATRWARRQQEETERTIRFDTRRLWADTLEQLAKDVLDALESNDMKLIKKTLSRVKQSAETTLSRIWSVQPGSMLTNSYERFIASVTIREDWSIETCREQVQDLAR